MNLVELSQDPQWLNLIHYKKSLFGWRSEVATKNFFLSPHGKVDPLAELESTLDLMLKKENEFPKNRHPQCLFPGRKKFILEKGVVQENELPFVSCPLYDLFRQRTKAQSATFIFSSYYLNTPASAFGHTLLRLNQSEKNDQGGLLDAGINYAATVDTDNALLYALKGLAGFFHGQFSLFPYYFKVREYNDFESRDLWEYELNLTHNQIDWMLAHLWDLGESSFNYYYLTQNCSYHLLGLLDVADPSLHLLDQVGYFVIPSETVKIVYDVKKGKLIKKIVFRPSALSRFLARMETLNLKEKSYFLKQDLLDVPKETLKEFTPESQAAILDTMIDYYDFRFAKELLKNDETILQKKWPYLVARGNLPISPRPLHFAEKEQLTAPHLGHPSMRWGLFGGIKKGGGSLWQGDFRFAHHTLEDPTVGHVRSSMVVGQFKFSYSQKPSHFQLDSFNLVDVFSLSPLSLYSQFPSWRVRMGIEPLPSILNSSSSTKYSGMVQFAFGPSYSLFHKSFIFYFLLSNQLWPSFSMKQSTLFPWTFGWETGVHIEWNRWIYWGNYTQQFNIHQEGQKIIDNSFLYSINPLWSGAVKVHYEKKSTSFLMGLYHYF